LKQFSPDRDLYALAAAAFGAATTCLFGLLSVLVSPRHQFIFHWHGSTASAFVPVLLDYLLLSLIIFLVLAGIRHRLWLKRIIWPALFFLLCVGAFENTIYFVEVQPAHWLKVLLLALCLLLSLSVALCPRPDDFEWLRRAGQYLLQAIFFAGLLLFIEVLWYGFKARNLEIEPPNTEASVAIADTGAHHHRVYWIILDELAFRQVFMEHPQGEDLPAFEALRAQSTLFTNTKPAGLFTDFAIPSLVTGRNVLDTHTAADGQSFQIETANEQWIPFDRRDTIFGDAQSLGYHTAIVGWHFPYCRVLANTFSYCSWASAPQFTTFLPSESVLANLIEPVLHPGGKSAQAHLNNFLQLSLAADHVLKNRQYDFVLLHMPVPHPFGIYDRKTKTYALGRSSYVDNLVLADIYLAHIRQVLEEQDGWDDATVLLMGDHSWRTQIWSKLQPWSADDSQANHAGFDPRPVYLLKLPHQRGSVEVSTAYEAVHTRSLLNALLRGELQTSSDVQKWIATSRPLPTSR